MSRSKKDILDTESMLARLASLLYDHNVVANPKRPYSASHADAEVLRRISMTLHRWHELECGDSNGYSSWCITRGSKVRITKPAASTPCTEFVHDDDGKPYLERHYYPDNAPAQTTYSPIPDREAGAMKRLKAIMARYPALSYYVQGDPRGCALYILRPGDVQAGKSVDAYYSRGLAVFK